ncbi:ATP-binding protein [Streptosporangium subroseum]|uniref:ATP-binding protein n=1 Tax=Streptosporangium subroseum TaxID=106412 RepID=UPI003F4DB2CF
MKRGRTKSQAHAEIPRTEQVRAPDGWTKTFTEPRLCAAIVDRLTFNATIIETGTNSYRMAHGRAKTQTGDTA